MNSNLFLSVLSVLLFSQLSLAQNVTLTAPNDPNSQQVYDQGGISKIQRLNMTETALNDVKQRLSELEKLKADVNVLKQEMAELKRKMGSQIDGVK